MVPRRLCGYLSQPGKKDGASRQGIHLPCLYRENKTREGNKISKQVSSVEYLVKSHMSMDRQFCNKKMIMCSALDNKFCIFMIFADEEYENEYLAFKVCTSLLHEDIRPCDAMYVYVLLRAFEKKIQMYVPKTN